MMFAKTLHERDMMSEEDYKSFEASRGYLNNLRKRRDIVTFRLQGEGSTMSDTEPKTLMSEFRGRLKSLMQKYNVTEVRRRNIS